MAESSRCPVGPVPLLEGSPKFVIAVAAAAALFAAGCGAPGHGSLEPWHDLIDGVEAAEISTTTRFVDLGSPSATPLMVSGWSSKLATRDADGVTLTWTEGRAAVLRFLMPSARDTVVRFSCAPLGPDDQPPVGLDIWVNGRPWTEIELRRGFREYRQDLPAKLLRNGWNVLTIGSSPARPPETHAARVVRHVVWDWIEFGSRQDVNPPSYEVVDDTLHLPPETELAYNLQLPPDSWLAASLAEEIRPTSETLSLTWIEEGAAPDQRREMVLVPGENLVPLTSTETAIGRLTLMSMPGTETVAKILSLKILRSSDPTVESSKTENLEASAPPTSAPGGPRGLGRVNVLVYLIDTLRADHMGCYGYHRPTTPEIDSFARRAVLFENAQAQSPWTRASVATLFTGLWPEAHGTQDRKERLPERITTLAELLSDDGYACFGATANGNSHAPWGFDQGFQELQLVKSAINLIPRSNEVARVALDWLDRRDPAVPFFLWIHTVDPHVPYSPPEPFRSTFAPDVPEGDIGTVEHLIDLMRNRHTVTQNDIDSIVNLYDAEIAANDASFGTLLDELRDRDLFDSTLIILLSDHGEEFYEHGGWTHGKTLYAEMLDVPLIIKPPGPQQARRVTDLAQHIDIMPTVLDFAKAAGSSELPGHSLRALMSGASTLPQSTVAIAQMRLDGRVGSSMIDESWKVVVRNYDGIDAFPRLYNRQHDRQELKNSAAAYPTRAQQLAARMRALETLGVRLHGREEVDLESNPEIEEQLRALGYIE